MALEGEAEAQPGLVPSGRVALALVGIAQLPEKDAGVAAQVNAVGDEEAETGVWSKVELGAQLEEAPVAGGFFRPGKPEACTDERRETVPGLAAREIQLEIRFNERGGLVHRSRDRPDSDQRVEDHPLHLPITQEQSHLDGAAGADIVAKPIQLAVMRGYPEASAVAGKIRGKGRESMTFRNVAIRRAGWRVTHLGQQARGRP